MTPSNIIPVIGMIIKMTTPQHSFYKDISWKISSIEYLNSGNHFEIMGINLIDQKEELLVSGKFDLNFWTIINLKEYTKPKTRLKFL